jgi:Domain of unknown function (DUF4249)
MMKYLARFTWCLFLFLASCEKDIDISLDTQLPKLVVDASIENGKVPVVFLSTSLNYFGQISPEILSQSFVRNASVMISDGTKSHQLVEDSIITAAGYYIYYYSNNPAQPATSIIGQFEKTYELTISVDSKEYMASTRIPSATKMIDSIWWRPASFTDDGDTSQVEVMIKATDPPGFGDYVRYFTQRNSEPFYPGYNSVYDDQVIDGTTYTIPVDRGTDRNLDREDDDVFFARGDTVVLKLCNIDKATFDFWRTFEFTYQSIGNPFSSPTKVVGNISNGALGYFGGYAAQYSSLIIPN